MLLFVMFSQIAINLFNDCQCSVQNNVCEITAFYEITTSEPGVKVLTNQDNLAEASILLKTVRLDEGSCDIQMTRKVPTLFLITDFKQTGKIAANKFYLKTRYSHEFANNDKAFFKVEGNFGMVKGKLTFK